jgi:hypothetical protein
LERSTKRKRRWPEQLASEPGQNGEALVTGAPICKVAGYPPVSEIKLHHCRADFGVVDCAPANRLVAESRLDSRARRRLSWAYSESGRGGSAPSRRDLHAPREGGSLSASQAMDLCVEVFVGMGTWLSIPEARDRAIVTAKTVHRRWAGCSPGFVRSRQSQAQVCRTLV